MKNSKHLQWLYRELPALTNAGIISAETAEKLRNYYGEIKEGNKSGIAMIIFGVLGARKIFAHVDVVEYSISVSAPCHCPRAVVSLMNAVSFGSQPKQVAISIKTPSASRSDNLKGAFAVAMEQLVPVFLNSWFWQRMRKFQPRDRTRQQVGFSSRRAGRA